MAELNKINILKISLRNSFFPLRLCVNVFAIVTQPVWRGRLDGKLRGFAPNPVRTKKLDLFI